MFGSVETDELVTVSLRFRSLARANGELFSLSVWVSALMVQIIRRLTLSLLSFMRLILTICNGILLKIENNISNI